MDIYKYVSQYWEGKNSNVSDNKDMKRLESPIFKGRTTFSWFERLSVRMKYYLHFKYQIMIITIIIA